MSITLYTPAAAVPPAHQHTAAELALIANGSLTAPRIGGVGVLDTGGTRRTALAIDGSNETALDLGGTNLSLVNASTAATAGAVAEYLLVWMQSTGALRKIPLHAFS